MCILIAWSTRFLRLFVKWSKLGRIFSAQFFYARILVNTLFSVVLIFIKATAFGIEP